MQEKYSPLLSELDDLSSEIEERYKVLEERWVLGHLRAQGLIDALGIAPVVPLDGLYAFLTKGTDCFFERSVVELYSESDDRTKEIERKYHYGT